MDNNDVSHVSVNSNMYQSIVEENTSMYYSFNETLKSKMQTSNDDTNVNDSKIEEKFENSNPGTVIKKYIETSPGRNDGGNIAINKNILMMNMRRFPSQTSTPTQSPIIKYNKSQQQQQMSEKQNISDNTANISGVVPFGLQQQQKKAEIVTENESKNEVSNSLPSKIESITASLCEFEKLEKMTTDNQELELNDACFVQNGKEKLDNNELSKQIKRKSIENYIGELNFSQIKFEDETKEKNLVNSAKKIQQIPIILIESPKDQKERSIKLTNAKNRKSVNVSSDENENKENIENNDVKNTSIKKSFTNKNVISDKSEQRESDKNETEQTVISSASTGSSSIIKIDAEMHASKSSITSNEKSSLVLLEILNKKINKSDETSAKESEDEKKNQLAKKKVRRSIRVLQGTRKSFIEETDSSSDAKSSCRVNKKLQKLNIDSIKQNLKKPSVAINRFKNPFVQIQEKSSNSEVTDEIDKSLNKLAINNKGTKTQLMAIEGTSKMNTLQKSNEVNKIFVDKRKTLNQIFPARETNTALRSKSVLANRKSLYLKIEKGPRSPRFSKSKPRLTNAKTTLNSPSMARRNSTSKLSTRKSVIPVVSQNKKPTTKEAPTTTKSIAVDTAKKFKISATLYNCRVCHASFKLKSSFETHRKIHEIAIQCEYCDKKFSISKALDNHLIENCSKIPPIAKKKLIESKTKKKVEEQEQHIQKMCSEVSSASSVSSKCSIKLDQDHTDSLKLFTVREKANVEEKVSELVLPAGTPLLSMLPPSSSKLKTGKYSKVPFSGIYRTPNKPIVCYKCKKNFLNILAFTEHSLSHSSSQSSSEN